MKMKAQEIHGMTNDELATKLSDLKDELYNLHNRQATGQLENPTVIKTTKKDIARIKTEIRARELKASV